MGNQTIDPKGPLAPNTPLPQPAFDKPSARVPAICHSAAAGETEWYPPVMLGAKSLASRITQTSEYVRKAYDLIGRLEADDYSRYMARYYRKGIMRFGDAWGYADIVTALLGLAETLRPRNYLEIGVRRGRSVCAVASMVPKCELVMFDMWLANYAGMENPGPDLVRAELARVGHRGPATFIDGNSHDTVPKYFADNPDKYFDMITVDGDHTNLGAAQDLADVMPRLAVGGALVFDDVCHPKHPGLRDVWRRMVADNPRFATWTYDEVGYGVGFAIRKW